MLGCASAGAAHRDILYLFGGDGSDPLPVGSSSNPDHPPSLRASTYLTQELPGLNRNIADLESPLANLEDPCAFRVIDSSELTIMMMQKDVPDWRAAIPNRRCCGSNQG